MNILEYENYQEKIPHGNPLFPYIPYPCSIPLDFSRVPLHWHDEMEIIYIKKGTGAITVDFKSYVVTKGTIALILPGRLHSIEQYMQESMEYENIIFHPHFQKNGHQQYRISCAAVVGRPVRSALISAGISLLCGDCRLH